MDDKSKNKIDSNIVNTVLGASFIVAGILFIIGRNVGIQFKFDFWHYTWPVAIVTPGLLLFVASFAFEYRMGLALAIIGWLIATTGTILLIQNTFDVYASWAYSWALVVPTSIGMAKMIYGSVRGIREQVQKGLNLVRFGLVIFLIGGIFFDGIIGISGFGFGNAWLCWPGMLIGLGLILMASKLLPRRNSTLSIIEDEIGESDEQDWL